MEVKERMEKGKSKENDGEKERKKRWMREEERRREEGKRVKSG